MKNVILAISTVIGSFIAAVLGGIVAESSFFRVIMNDKEMRDDLIKSMQEGELGEDPVVVDNLINMIHIELSNMDAETFYENPLYKNVTLNVLTEVVAKDDRYSSDYIAERLKLIRSSERNFSKVRKTYDDLVEKQMQ